MSKQYFWHCGQFVCLIKSNNQRLSLLKREETKRIELISAIHQIVVNTKKVLKVLLKLSFVCVFYAFE